MTTKQLLHQTILKAVRAHWPELAERTPDVTVEYPRDASHGAYATTVAMQLAPVLRQSPMAIAETLAADLRTGPLAARFDRIEPVAPGFLNFHLKLNWLARLPATVVKAGDAYGASDLGKNERIHVEFISANPTGPLHLGNGRGAFLGDTLANVYAAAGYRPWREYYVNDAGKQVDTLAESVAGRYFQQQGIKKDYGEELYQGEYVNELAKRLNLEQYKIRNPAELKKRIGQRAANLMLRDIQRFAETSLGIRFDRWFRETELYHQKIDTRVRTHLDRAGLSYEHEGALWMRTTQFGDDKDRVLVKGTGEQTYFLSDVAYLYDKFVKRSFPRGVVILGADHHGYVGRLQAAASALGRGGQYQVILYQLVRLLRDGQEVRMSKRSGTFVTLQELVEELGIDVTRFFFLLHSAGVHMDFDLTLAKDRSEKNPVYYVQYAHARTVSILREIAKRALPTTPGTAHAAEGEGAVLAALLLRYPELIEDVARSAEVHRLPQYGIELADQLHRFYTQQRVIDGGHIHAWRAGLVAATKTVLANVLHLMGVSAPEQMDRSSSKPETRNP